MARFPKIIPIAVASLGLTVAGARAGQTLDWGGAALTDDFDSAGNALNDATYTFALGTFGDQGIWSPSAANVDDWAGHWKEIDRVDVYHSTFKYITGSYLLDDNLSFAKGEQAYIWIYNAEAGDAPLTPDPVDPGPAAEWGLYTNLNGAAWAIPDAAAAPDTWGWRFSVADTAVFGGIEQHDSGGAPTGELIGAGERTFVPSGQYEVQTYTFPPPVPEPSVALLGGLALAFAGCRRRR